MMILTYIAKKVYVLIHVTAFINFCTQIFYTLHNLFAYDTPQSKFDLTIKMYRSILCHHYYISGQRASKLFMKSYVLEFFHVWSCHKIGQGQFKVIIWIILLLVSRPLVNWFWRSYKGFYHIWAWWPYWSCDLESLNIFLFLKATYEIWLQLAYWLSETCLKL